MAFFLDAFGIYDTSRTTRKAAREEEALATEEAAQIDARAKRTLAAGSYNSDRIRKKAHQILSSQRARAAAQGNDTTSGSSLEIAKDTIKEASIDQLLVMAEAEEDAAKDRYLADVTRRTGQRQADRLRSQAKAGVIAGTSTLLKDSYSWLKSFS